MTGQMTLSQLTAVQARDTTHDVVGRSIRDHARFVYGVAYSVLRNSQDAEDAVQETFLRVMRHEREFRKVADQRAWLARAAWRIAVDRRRKQPAVSLDDQANSQLLDQLRSSQVTPEGMVINAQMLGLLQALIATLPSDLRDVVTLMTVREMSSAEVAAVLDIPETSVRTRQFRARQLLKEKFVALLQRRTDPSFST